MNSSGFIFDFVELLYNKIEFDSEDSPDWLKNKKATTNPINKKNSKCFQCLQFH